MIEPTVGRIVWVWIHSTQPQPLAAIVASVRNTNLINVSVFDAFGKSFDLQNLTLYQGEGNKPVHPYAEWMPYQKSQAAKYDQLEKELKK